MKIGVFSTFMSPLSTPQMIRDFGRRAEGMGLDSIWMGEHVALFDKNTYGYPGSKDGRIPVPDGGGLLDVTATFGFLTAATSKLRLGTGVALVPQRNPMYTAQEICTLDSAFARAGRKRDKAFEIIITPPMRMSVDAMQQYAELGVHRLVVNLGSQLPERVDQRMAEIGKLVKMAT